MHLLQIWIVPDVRGIAPSYEQKAFAPEEKRGHLRLVASGDGRDGSLTIRQDAGVYAAVLAPGERVEHAPSPGRHAYLHVVRGAAAVNGTALGAGDGIKLRDESRIEIAGGDAEAEVLLFDLP